MKPVRIAAALRRQVRERARERCEYCLLAETEASFLTNLITSFRGSTAAKPCWRTLRWPALTAIASKVQTSPQWLLLREHSRHYSIDVCSTGTSISSLSTAEFFHLLGLAVLPRAYSRVNLPHRIEIRRDRATV